MGGVITEEPHPHYHQGRGKERDEMNFFLAEISYDDHSTTETSQWTRTRLLPLSFRIYFLPLK